MPRWDVLNAPPLHIDTVETHLDPDNEYPLYVRESEVPDRITRIWVVTTGSVIELGFDIAAERWEKDVHHSGDAAETVRTALLGGDSQWVHVQDYDSLQPDLDADALDGDPIGDLFERTGPSEGVIEFTNGSKIHFNCRCGQTCSHSR